MAKLNYALFCEYSLISREGIPSFISVYSQIITELPFVKTIHLVTNSMLEGAEKNGIKELEIIVKKPDGEKIATQKSKILPIKEEVNELGFISNIKDIKFEKEGIYAFEVAIDGKKIGSTELRVKNQPKQ